MVRIVELGSTGPALEQVYEEVLCPSFPADELVSWETFKLGAAAAFGTGLNWVALEGDAVLGAAIGEWDAEHRIVLLSWLAARPGLRGRGVGGSLLDAALAQWQTRLDPCLVLVEVEDPTRHLTGSDAHGDPTARLRFYRRRGARALDLPYFQPSLRPGKSRVRGLLLMAFHADQRCAGTAPDTVDGRLLRSYLEKYQIDCEGAVATDEEAMRLWRAVDRPEGVPLLP